jgi:hypothetical protein
MIDDAKWIHFVASGVTSDAARRPSVYLMIDLVVICTYRTQDALLLLLGMGQNTTISLDYGRTSSQQFRDYL